MCVCVYACLVFVVIVLPTTRRRRDTWDKKEGKERNSTDPVIHGPARMEFVALARDRLIIQRLPSPPSFSLSLYVSTLNVDPSSDVCRDENFCKKSNIERNLFGKIIWTGRKFSKILKLLRYNKIFLSFSFN